MERSGENKDMQTSKALDEKRSRVSCEQIGERSLYICKTEGKSLPRCSKDDKLREMARMIRVCNQNQPEMHLARAKEISRAERRAGTDHSLPRCSKDDKL